MSYWIHPGVHLHLIIYQDYYLSEGMGAITTVGRIFSKVCNFSEGPYINGIPL